MQNLMWTHVAVAGLMASTLACTDKIEADGRAPHVYQRLFPAAAAPAGEPLLALADGLTGPKPDVVIALRSFNALLTPAAAKRLQALPVVKAMGQEMLADLAFDPIASIALDKPVVLIGQTDKDFVWRFSVTQKGKASVSSASEVLVGDGKPIAFKRFTGKVTQNDGEEFCVLTHKDELIAGLGPKACTRLAAAQDAPAAWRKAYQSSHSLSTPPVLSICHGDTRSDVEPSGIPLLDKWASEGWDYEFGCFHIGLPGKQIEVQYRARPAEADALQAGILAARDALPPIAAVPVGAPIVMQFRLPFKMAKDFQIVDMTSALLGGDLLIQDWPDDEVLPVLFAVEKNNHDGVLAVGVSPERYGRLTSAWQRQEKAFEDAPAWRVGRATCVEGPRKGIFCAPNRRFAAGAVARARTASIDRDTIIYINMQVKTIAAQLVAGGLPADIVNIVGQAIVRGKWQDGLLDIRMEANGSTQPLHSVAVDALLKALGE